MTKLNECLERARRENRSLLIGYITAGYPDLQLSVAAARVLAEHGCDVIEVGIPYSDPGMDGPVIQETSQIALNNGFRVSQTFALVEAVSECGAVPLVMSYYNPLLQYGLNEFCAQFSESGGAGVITPDLPPDEAQPWMQVTDEYNISRVFLAAQSSRLNRLQLISKASTGFVYAASRMGVTGVQNEINVNAKDLVDRVRQAGAEYVCVGIGVSNRRQAREVAKYADGVIVGSALLKTLLGSKDWDKKIKDIAIITEEIKHGVSESRMPRKEF